MRRSKEPGLTDTQLEALYFLIARGPYKSRRGARSAAIKSLIALGYATATVDASYIRGAEVTEKGREAYKNSK